MGFLRRIAVAAGMVVGVICKYLGLDAGVALATGFATTAFVAVAGRAITGENAASPLAIAGGAVVGAVIAAKFANDYTEGAVCVLGSAAAPIIFNTVANLSSSGAQTVHVAAQQGKAIVEQVAALAQEGVDEGRKQLTRARRGFGKE